MLRKHTLIKPPITLSQIEWEQFNTDQMAAIHKELHGTTKAQQWLADQEWNTRYWRQSAPTVAVKAVKAPVQRVKVSRSWAEKISLTWLLVTDRRAAEMIMRLEELAAERRASVQSGSKSHFLR